MDTYFIYDLKNSFPSQQVPNVCTGKMDGKKVNNALKVYVDGTKSLSI